MSYFTDPHANYTNGLYQGQAMGRSRGFNEGVSQGYQSGYHQGWEEGVAAGNEQILAQMAHTRQHIADKQNLEHQIGELRHALNQQAAYIAKLETERAQQAKEKSGLFDLLGALKASHDEQDADIASLKATLQEKTHAFNDHLWQYNRAVVFMNSVRNVLSDLAAGNDAMANQLRAKFVQTYNVQSAEAIKGGSLKVQLHTDPEFAKTLPNSQHFLVSMLQPSAAQTSTKAHASSIERA